MKCIDHRVFKTKQNPEADAARAGWIDTGGGTEGAPKPDALGNRNAP